MSALQSRNELCRCGSGLKYKKCCLPADAAKQTSIAEPAVIVCTPTRGQPCFETLLALRHNMDGVKSVQTMAARKPVIEARNALALGALNVMENNPLQETPSEWFVLWCDDDAWWPPSTIKTMLRFFAESSGCDALFGKFGGRMPYSNIFAYRDPKKYKDCFVREGVNCETGDIVEIAEAGFHFVMMRAALLEKVGPNPFTMPPGSDERITEDFAFCHRATAAGARLAVATGMPVIHIDPKDGAAYAPGMPAMMMDGNSVAKLTLEHITPTGAFKEPEMRAYGPGVADASSFEGAEEAYKARLNGELRRRAAVSSGLCNAAHG